jgi:hypothetical protein
MVNELIRSIVFGQAIQTFTRTLIRSVGLSVDPGKIQVGQTFSRISHKEFDENYYNCRIVDLDELCDVDGKSIPGQIIYFEYEYSNGEIFDPIDDPDDNPGIFDDSDPLFKEIDDADDGYYVDFTENGEFEFMELDDGFAGINKDLYDFFT